jgi:hypothetical protein
MNQEEKLRLQPGNVYRIPGVGRKLSCESLDELLAKYLYNERLQNKRVTRSMIVSWEQELARDPSVQLQFSEGWLRSFFERHGFCLRRATNKPSLTDIEIVNRAA